MLTFNRATRIRLTTYFISSEIEQIHNNESCAETKSGMDEIDDRWNWNQTDGVKIQFCMSKNIAINDHINFEKYQQNMRCGKNI